MKNLADPRVLVVLLALGASLAVSGQDQPTEKKQQTKQNQRLLYQHVYRHDEEGMLEDPAITNQVTYEEALPDSNEQNVESREVTLDDLRRQRFVSVPAPGEEMQFVPGKGYVAGSTEEATEPGMSVLAPTLGFQTGTGLSSSQYAPGGTELPTGSSDNDGSHNSPVPQADGNPYTESPDPLLSLDPSQAGAQTMGIGSALERRPPVPLPAHEPSPLQKTVTEFSNTLTEFSNTSTFGKSSPESGPFHRSGPEELGRRTCAHKIDPATIHDRAEFERLSRQGCLTRPVRRITEGLP